MDLAVNNYWKQFKHFKKDDIDFPQMSSYWLVSTMNLIREKIGKPLVIHRSFDPNASKASAHSNQPCQACDFHIEGGNLFNDFMEISRIPGITAIGVYPYWINKGFHIETEMQQEHRKYWIRDESSQYLPIATWTIHHILDNS